MDMIEKTPEKAGKTALQWMRIFSRGTVKSMNGRHFSSSRWDKDFTSLLQRVC